jgi:rhodanese-related sulfurtransferase
MMISLRSVFLTTLILITAGPCFSSHIDITAQQAKDLIDTTENLIIVDVREKSEYCDATGHIPGALNYPWNSGILQARYEELPMDSPILVVCRSGNRSNQAASFLDSKGYTLVYNMLGGMNAWLWETSACKYAGGSGTAADPYQIATAEDLIALGESTKDYDKHFILTADIDLDPNQLDGKVFDRAVIAPDRDDSSRQFAGVPFTGTFDGNGRVISKLTIEGNYYLGLFGYVDGDAIVSDLSIEAVDVNGIADFVGSLAGFSYGSIIRCYSTGEVNGNDDVGGLVGYNSIAADITNCYSAVAVCGNERVGGLVGYTKGNITMCYSAGKVIGEGQNISGLVGERHLSYGIVTDCFWDIETSGQTSSDGGEGKTTAEMMDPNMFISAGWDFIGETVNGPNDIWWILEGRDYPRLWWQLPADDFEDGQPEPFWFVYNMEPDLAWLEETNGRLEINTVGAMEDVDAIYVSDGWWLDANEPFAIRVDFHYSMEGNGDGRLTLGLVPSIEGDVVQWAQFEVGTFDDKPFYLYEVRDGDWVREEINDRFSDDGILYVSYEPDGDELYFSDTGYGKDKAMWTVKRLVSDRWQSDSIYITIGGGSDQGMALTGEDAWFDNFTVDSGSILQ